jgi:peroxiredoxin Q/BCP
MLEVGETAPAFELPNQDGETVSLEEFRGQRVVVYFYPRADTRGCTMEAQSFRDEFDAFHERDAVVLGVSDDPVADLADFAEKYDLPFDLLSDADGEVGRAYDSYGTRTVGEREVTAAFRNTYVVDEEGRIAAAHEGVHPEDHAEDVLADL